MSYKVTTTTAFESETCEGVTIYLRKMTEGRRLKLRDKLMEANSEIRSILREQITLEENNEDSKNESKILELQDKFDALMLGTINPAWISWGVKNVKGLVDEEDRPMSVDDWANWPSELYQEVLEKVKETAEVGSTQRKNLESPTTSSTPVGGSQTSLSAESVKGEDSTKLETVDTSPTE